MDKQNITVLRKILYAVESGDQVYGKQDYSCFAGVGANCSNEKAITIGAGQWYAGEAKELLYRIQRANPKLFKDMDNAGMEKDLLMKSWDTYAVTAESAKGQCIISIISTNLGEEMPGRIYGRSDTDICEEHRKTYGPCRNRKWECIMSFTRAETVP